MIELEVLYLQVLVIIIGIYFEFVELLVKVIIDNLLVVICDGGVIKIGYDVELDELQVLSENVG